MIKHNTLYSNAHVDDVYLKEVIFVFFLQHRLLAVVFRFGDLSPKAMVIFTQ